MKKSITVLLLVGLFCLSACQRIPFAPLSTALERNAGAYGCTALSIQDLSLDPNGKWIRLDSDGTAGVCLAGAEEPGRWDLSGEQITLTLDGEDTVGSLKDGVLEICLREMEGTYVRGTPSDAEEEKALPEASDPAPSPEETEAPEPPEEETSPGEQDPAVTEEPSSASEDRVAPPAEEEAALSFSCYGGLYTMEYPADRFQPGEPGGPDLQAEDGTMLWFSRLSTAELVRTWLDGFMEKGTGQQYLSYEGHSWSVGVIPAQSIVYQDEDGWHAEAILSFDRDRGTAEYPMYAAYVTVSGPERESVWNADIRSILNSIHLGDE